MLPGFVTPFELFTFAPVFLILIILIHALLYTMFTAQKDPFATLVIRRTNLFSSLVALAVGLAMGATFDKAAVGYQFMEKFGDSGEYSPSFPIGLDGLSYVFMILTLFTFPFLFLAS
jgi:NADH:ubiquinone oxidoreductase subunit 4 (subunit M)